MLKKIFSTVLALSMTFSASAFAAGNGDVNNDGEVNLIDAQLVLNFATGRSNSVPNRANADINGDGFIDKADAQGILNIIRQDKVFNTYSKTATRRTNAYANYQLTKRYGNEWVDAGDNVTVLQEYENALLVRYPTRNGTKDRWVNKNEIFSGGDSLNVPANLQSLINTYNNKTWKDHTYLANVKQCKEFASFIFNKLYGVGYIGGGSVTSNAKNYLINLANPNRVALRGYRTNLTAQSARELFQSAQPGDFVQIRRRHGGPHSGIFVNRTGDGIILFEANADGKNSIRTNTYSYSDLANKNFAMSLYCAK